MIALVKIYKKPRNREGLVTEVAGAQPYAIYDDGVLKLPDEGELFEIFPNNGKIFVPESLQPPQKETFKLFELNESNSFDKARPTSMKYLLGKEIYNINLYEVLDLDESIALDKTVIVEKLTNGIYIPFNVTSPILFRTADDFLIGPLQMEFLNGIYTIKDSNLNFIPYYQQEIDIISLLDGYKGQERLFSTNSLLQQHISGWIDVADEQRVISDALKQLRDNAELGELSRRMITKLKEWYDSDRAREPHLQERLQRAIQIMESNTLSSETVDLFSKLVLDLEITNELIQKQTKQAFNKEYEGFLKEHEKLLKECESREQELQILEERYSKTSQAFEKAQSNYISLEQNMQAKIEQLHNNFSTLYAEQLALSAFPNVQSSISVSKTSNSANGYTQFQSTSGKKLEDFSSFAKALNNNLSYFKGNDDETILAATVATAIILEEPIIIYGDHCFELAQCIAKTVACEQTLSIIPEIDCFSLDDLHHQYTNYSDISDVKSLIIHNPHTTTGLYSLPAYFKQSKWSEGELVPNLTIITIDSLEDANSFINKMLYKPLINSTDFMSRFINKRTIKSIHSGQMQLETIENMAIEDYSVSVRRDFRQWIEDNKDFDKVIPYQLVEWLNQIGSFVEDEVLYEASYTLFENSIPTNDKNAHGVGV